jgi:hypothetical protein
MQDGDIAVPATLYPRQREKKSDTEYGVLHAAVMHRGSRFWTVSTLVKKEHS